MEINVNNLVFYLVYLMYKSAKIILPVNSDEILKLPGLLEMRFSFIAWS